MTRRRACEVVDVDGTSVRVQTTTGQPLTDRDKAALAELVAAVRHHHEQETPMTDTPGRSPILRYFAATHLPIRLRRVSRPFAELADLIEDTMPVGAEKSTALRKLLEAKDAAVRAALDLPVQDQAADRD